MGVWIHSTTFTTAFDDICMINDMKSFLLQ
jgi:hypothetical protein